MSYAPVVLADRRDSSNFRPTPQTPRLKIPFWPGGADRDQFAVELGGRICLVLRMTTCCGRPFFLDVSPTSQFRHAHLPTLTIVTIEGRIQPTPDPNVQRIVSESGFQRR